ncbi:hypothetical protein HELRODRAFT_178316 [Helobdella robusta]|uniref:Uncharacterized protein n=1 Tax=Helobdella robusta TaxID=6412 RepID=T1FD26_HELRO|nr:hypothetical protein HELRODRAFT_178316 [Helobdella robusta]ESN97198.1 hypothetical protein HELRODRAFT_178316 [Helobdella robusta]
MSLNANNNKVSNTVNQSKISTNTTPVTQCWGDRHDSSAVDSHCESHDEAGDGFKMVTNKKQRKSPKSNHFSQLPNTNSGSKTLSKKIFGTGLDCPFKASKVIVKKTTYYVGNVGPCGKNVIEDHLKSKNIAITSCFPILRKKNSDDPPIDVNTESTAFKIVLPVDDLPKLLNPDIWPQYAFFREWDYSKIGSAQLSSQNAKTTDHGGIKFDLVAVTETWLRDATSALINLSGFKFVCVNRIGNIGGGVGLFVRDGLNYYSLISAATRVTATNIVKNAIITNCKSFRKKSLKRKPWIT